MLNIVCINAGDYLGRGVEYTNILADMISRNISDKVEYKFVCFTDTPQGIDADVDIRPLPVDGLDGWWNKISLFKEGLFRDGDRILYFDLDTVITSGLDEIIKYDGEFAILRDFFHQDGFQSSVMAWGANTHTHIWEQWLKAGMPKTNEGDQAWIEKMTEADFWQDLFPDYFVSYKLQAFYQIPKASKVIVFHGEPRPHEAKGWIEKIWKVGGGSALELQHVCNTEFDKIEANIKNALSLPFSWLQPTNAHDGHAVIVGGGPSLKYDLAEIKERQIHGQKIFSTNATYKYLLENNIIPDFHVMVDAREENVEFVPFGKVACYYASICHPKVLEKAENVILWHPMIEGILEIIGDNTGDPLVGGGGTVGMKSIALAHILGYREFHLYGFDSSYHGDDNHAYKQSLNDGERVIEVEMNGNKYRAAAWMCGQLEDFKAITRAIVDSGGIITVHGYGLLPDMAKTMVFRMPAAQMRAEAILSRINIVNPIGAEIGVFTGDLSSRLLKNGVELYMVDSWTTSEEESEYTKSGDFHAKLKQREQDKYFEHTLRIVEPFGDKAKIIRKSSIEAAKDIEDKTLDFVFIDADHSYDGCKADILAWLPKIKDGGLLSGHDYKNIYYPCFGVEKAVDEFSENNNLPVELGENFTWFIRLAA